MENNQVGIITFPSVDNYGAVLQAYALQHYIEISSGYNVEIIDYRETDDCHGPFVFVRATHNFFKDFVLSVIRFFNYSNIKRRHERFEVFRKELLHLTHQRYIGTGSLKQLCKDFYITGSDQVFNPRLKNYKAYYLDFDKGHGKKIAYAPSFGISTFNDDITRQILPLLTDFDVVSCREESGAFYLSKILNRTVPTVVDPVFLLSKEEWSRVAILPKRKKYLLVYCLSKGKSKQLQKIAKEVAAKECLDIVTIENEGPREFVGYIMGADFVVTDSFHGTSFSLIFGKRHISCIINKSKGTRIENVMRMVGKEEELVYDLGNYSYKSEAIKTYSVSNLLEIERSKDFLKTHLSN